MRQVILGIDPGFRNTGVGIIRTNPLRCASYKHINAKGYNEQDALEHIFIQLKLSIEKYEPTFMVYERANKNHKNAMIQTVISLLSSFYDIPLYGYAPVHIKKIITGDHRADKATVAKTVYKVLEMNDGKLVNHITDALACALTLYYKELTDL